MKGREKDYVARIHYPNAGGRGRYYCAHGNSIYNRLDEHISTDKTKVNCKECLRKYEFDNFTGNK